ncbi:hypothetical protein LBMAG53_39000 [Planctomycetota bacterium]|nr:hypothetical protein LBMAG53_39000 [Planctomycetota bacterium]
MSIPTASVPARWVLGLLIVSTCLALIGRGLHLVIHAPIHLPPMLAWSVAIAAWLAAAVFVMAWWRASWPPLLLTATVVSTAILGWFGFVSWSKDPLQAHVFLKFASQIMTPLLTWWCLRGQLPTVKWIGLVVLACTFAGHGFLDVGIPKVPAEYLETTQKVLGVEQSAARSFLMAAGIGDFLVSILCWWGLTRQPALVAMVAWGFATNFARVVAYGQCGMFMWAEPWFFESLARLPHGLIPLALCLLWLKPQSTSSGTPAVTGPPIGLPASLR